MGNVLYFPSVDEAVSGFCVGAAVVSMEGTVRLRREKGVVFNRDVTERWDSAAHAQIFFERWDSAAHAHFFPRGASHSYHHDD